MEEPGGGQAMADFRAELHAWLDAHADELAPRYAPPGTLDEQIAQMQRVKAILFDAGWMRYGWPERVGGLGGSPMCRTELGAALAARDITDPGLFSLIEVLAPVAHRLRAARARGRGRAPPALGRGDVVPGLLRAGHRERPRVAELPGRRRRRRPRVGGINGQKVWTSLAQYSDRCVLLTRTGTVESRHRGITAFFVDMDTPGITVAPIEMINGVQEFAEVFFDDVVVPADRILGEVNGGWARRDEHPPVRALVVLLAAHRVPLPAPRAARRGRRPTTTAAPRSSATRSCQLHALRARSRATQHRLAAARRSVRRPRSTRSWSRRRSTRRTTRSAGSCPAWSRSTTPWPASMWRGEYLYSRPRPSTAAPPRCSATSSPAACSTSGTKRDGRGRTRAARGRRSAPRSPTCGTDADAAARRARLARDVRGRAARRDRDRVRRARHDERAPPRCSTTSWCRHWAARRVPTSRCCSRSSVRGTRRAHRRRHVRAGLATPACRCPRPNCSSCAVGAQPESSTVAGVVRDARAVRGHRPRGRLPPCAGRTTVPDAVSRSTPCAWDAAVALGRRAVAHQIAGASRAMLALARDARDWSGCSSAGRSCRSRRYATGSPRRWSRSRRSTRRWAPRPTNRTRLTAALAEGDRGPHRAHGRRPLPAGARRHRLHDRPSVPPLPQAHDAARRPVRIGRRDRRRDRAPTARRRAGCRRSSSSERSTP